MQGSVLLVVRLVHTYLLPVKAPHVDGDGGFIWLQVMAFHYLNMPTIYVNEEEEEEEAEEEASIRWKTWNLPEVLA